jgi:hypothetical protein
MSRRMYAAEKKVRALHPDARIERHRTGFPPRDYFLIRYGNSFMYAAEGKTQNEAWKNALADEPKTGDS